ncbi:hypothetical protein CKAN_00739100 [Cinnamomum micranthum f. kanehirae]|uniref:Uncharacterized protein n=1 Tax=Cinnamomum micranthum f. kanehirae TaxID=337451 RepID=A0A3S3NFW8_9MAGN|nr:hypothetical protein CKAN_00739100 [Cinnamomum micranthum f. kanehirae]
MKDLLEILFRQLGGPDARKIARRRTKAKGRPRCPLYQFTRQQSYYHRKTLKRKRVRNGSQEERILAERERVKDEMEKARELRKNRRTELARRVVEKYYSDSNYRFLHDKISVFFAESLKSDIGFLNSGEHRNIGLAAKWCPSLNSSFDRSTLLCESIAKLVFPRESDPSYSEIEEANDSYRVRDRLRKEILVPLRKSLKLPEVYMSFDRWGELPYERVPPLAMKRYKKIFEEHDRDRIWLFGMNKSMRMEILAARALLPHEIIFHQCYDIPTLADVDKVTELQWKRMVEDLSKKGKLRNILSVCQCGLDGKARRVSIAFGLLTSELSEEPWRGNVINFCEDPQLHRIQGETLREKVKSICRMKCWHKTDFLKVFDLILDVAVAVKLEEEKMVKRVLVFSYSDFDRASTNSWDADYAAIKRKYKEKGYGSSVPEIVFWNLRYLEEHPRMPRREKGVALVRGFSRNLLNNFLHNDGVVNPEEVMEAAIAGEERILLLGPPEIHPLPAPAGRPPSPFSSFIDAMNFINNNNNRVLEPKPLMWPKGNLSPTFQSSGNPCLDFFNMEQYTPRETVRELLRRAWAHNPLTTLKLILRRRVNSHGLLALVVLWLHQNHPKTLAWNVRWFAEVGYMKYLLDILFAKAKTAWWERYNSDSSYRLLYDNISDFLSESLKSDIGFLNSGEFNKIGLAAKWCLSLDSSSDRSTLLCETIAKKVFPRESDPSYSGIEESHYTYRVRDRLREEILAPLDKFHDLPVELRNLHMLYIYQLVSSVVRKTYKNFLEKQEPGRFSECLAELNEGYYKYLSERHEPKRFFELLDKVDKWEAKNSAEALLPHEILSYNNINEVKELQWKRMVEDLCNKGKLTNCLSVCDVSGSMDVSGRNVLPSSTIIDGKVGDFSRSMAATRMEVCVALGLLTSELSEKPWRGNVINFSPNPKLHTILGER